MGGTCAPTGIELELSEIAGRIRDVLCTQGLDKKGGSAIVYSRTKEGGELQMVTRFNR